MKNELVNKVISLAENYELSQKKILELKNQYDPNQVELVVSCITNDIDGLRKCIGKNIDLSICNGKVLRYTVSNGFVDVSVLLIKNNIEP